MTLYSAATVSELEPVTRSSGSLPCVATSSGRHRLSDEWRRIDPAQRLGSEARMRRGVCDRRNNDVSVDPTEGIGS